MARACNRALRLLPNSITTQLASSGSRARCRNLAVHAQLSTEDDAMIEPLKKVQVTQVQSAVFTMICLGDPWKLIQFAVPLVSIQSLRRTRRRGTGGARQSLVSVGTSCGGGDQWSSDIELTLRQLHLDDLIEDGQRDADVLVHLLVQQVIAWVTATE